MIQRLIWERLRYINRIPGAYQIFYLLADLYLKDGRVVKILRGPASGFYWRHYRGYQPWMALGMYEPSVAQLIYQSLKSGDVFYDIGANAGYFALVAAKAIGTVGKMIAFEPMTTSYNTVKEQIALNKLEHICSVEKIAISNENSTENLTIPTRNANAHLANINAPHIKNKIRNPGRIEKVICMSLDAYQETHPDYVPTLIKIDIEGAEVKALQGADQLLSGHNAPKLLITAHSNDLAIEVKKILIEHKYTITDFPDMIYAIPRIAS